MPKGVNKVNKNAEAVTELPAPLEITAQQPPTRTEDGNQYRLSQAFRLVMAGTPIEEACQFFDITIDNFKKVLKNYEALIAAPDELSVFLDNRNTIYSSVEMKVLQHLGNNEKLADSTAQQLASALREVVVARRLEAGQSTSNSAIMISDTPIDRFKR